jgi:cytochrome oxidase assembly protein ShyY1
VNAPAKYVLPGWLPYLVGALLVIQFAGLGGWQVSRGLEKRAARDLFNDSTAYGRYSEGMEVRPYQRLQVSGHFDGARQFLLDNIVIDGRLGYYVVTPLTFAPDAAPLLVNRGWLPRQGERFDASRIEVPATRVTVRGRAGSLPRAGYRMGDPIPPGSPWPKVAVYPGPEDVAAELGSAVQPVVLLMEPDDALGFFRHWVPEEMGPGRHFGYALQWFAMAAVLSVLLVWNYRKGRAGNG